MNACKYCKFLVDFDEEYTGEMFSLHENIDGGKQSFETYLIDDVENECKSLCITGLHTELLIEVKYCPNCGRKL